MRLGRAGARVANTPCSVTPISIGCRRTAADADGAPYFGDGSGTLYAVAPNGTVKTLASGWPSIRGVALDAANKRLFVAVSAAASGEPSSIRIVPIN